MSTLIFSRIFTTYYDEFDQQDQFSYHYWKLIVQVWSFRTLMAEVEGIMNSRPLTVEALSDVTSYKPLSPSDLLTMKSKVVLPPAGKFQKENLYTKKYWRRRVQHLAIAFWRQWRKELFLALQERQKWHL